VPAKAKYPSPPAQLRTLAEEARAAGKTFEEFWDAAVPPLVKVPQKVNGEVVGFKLGDDGEPIEQPATRLPRVDDEEIAEGAIRWPRDTFDRNCWHRAILSGREDWRCVYEGLDARGVDRSMSILADS
jgi:hypothetical protein